MIGQALAAESLTVDLRSGDVECAGAAGCLLAPNADAVAGAGAESAGAAPLLVRAGRVQLSARAATGCCVAAHECTRPIASCALPATQPPRQTPPRLWRCSSAVAPTPSNKTHGEPSRFARVLRWRAA